MSKKGQITDTAPGRLERLEPRLLMAADVSPAPILQLFESSYETIIDRTVDLWNAGYGFAWLPPPGRADISDFSVGYDVYDRFDFGSAERQTLYGSETGLREVASQLHLAGIDLHVDAIINHNGFSDQSTPGFLEGGGYPGFLLQNPDGDGDPFGVPGTDGDFNSAFDFGDLRGRLAGLIDIDHSEDFRFIRSPVPGFGVSPGDHGGNLPAGSTPDGAGRLANVPNEANRALYPDRNLDPITVFDPVTGEGGIQIFPFNLNDPLAGDPVGENATGYLMRYLQYMVQSIGVDGFRIDAAKHIEGFTFDFLDRAVYRANPRLNLDGSTNNVFSYSEVFDGDRGFLQTFVKKNIDPNDIGRVGGNRDALDFAQYFALRDNLTGNGFANDWRDVVNAGMDVFDDGLHNGSAGVMFVQSHDEFSPHLGNVAHAYMLMMPGNAVVYMNGKEFGDNRDFPKDGRGDALGGVFGDTIASLVNVRNTHGRGNYVERFIDKELFAFERESSAITLLSNRLDGGFDSRTLQNVGFAPGTHLVELTGNAANSSIDPFNDIPEVVTVNGDGSLNVRFMRNQAPNGNQHNSGYLVYGLGTPQTSGGLELLGVDSIIQGGNPGANGFENGTTRLADLHVIKGDSFTAKLQTVEVNHLGSIRDIFADGDNALLRLDGGVDLNGSDFVDFVTPGSPQEGFEFFGDKSSPLIGSQGIGGPRGDGEFRQTIDTTQLTEGVHFLEARAFRHRTDGGPAVYTPFKQALYIDRLPPESGIAESRKVNNPIDGDHDIFIDSIDFTADNVHVFANLPAAMSDQDILNMAFGGQGVAEQIDVNRFKTFVGGMPNGNNVLTVVTFEANGTSNVQRFTGQSLEGRGAGLGDLDNDGFFEVEDITILGDVFNSNNTQFNAAADVDGDGLVTQDDLNRFLDILRINGAGQDVIDAFEDLVGRPIIEAFIINNGDPQRSVVTTIDVRFSQDVSISVSAMQPFNLTEGELILTDKIAVSYDANTRTATFTFPGLTGGSLEDGDFELRIGASAVLNLAGIQLDGDNNGQSGGDHLVDSFRLFGDGDGNREVDIGDLFRFRAAAFTQQGDASFDFRYDADQNGDIEIFDLFQFRNNAFTSLPAPQPIQQQSQAPQTSPLLLAAFADAEHNLVATDEESAQPWLDDLENDALAGLWDANLAP